MAGHTVHFDWFEDPDEARRRRRIEAAPWWRRALHRLWHLGRYSHESGSWHYRECRVCGARMGMQSWNVYGVPDMEWLTRRPQVRPEPPGSMKAQVK